MLSIRCVKCKRLIPTGLNIDYETYRDLTYTERTLECPTCEELQTWNLDDVDRSVSLDFPHPSKPHFHGDTGIVADTGVLPGERVEDGGLAGAFDPLRCKPSNHPVLSTQVAIFLSYSLVKKQIVFVLKLVFLKKRFFSLNNSIQ